MMRPSATLTLFVIRMQADDKVDRCRLHMVPSTRL